MIRKAIALTWALIIVVSGIYLVWRLPAASIQSSIFALLPQQNQEPAVREVEEALRTELESRFLVLIVHADPNQAIRAAEAYAQRLRNSGAMKEVACTVPAGAVGIMLDFYEPHRFALLSQLDHQRISSDPGSLYESAQRTLYLPPGVSGSLGFKKDPFGTWGRWLASRSAAGAGLSVHDQHLTTTIDGKTAVAVLGTLPPRKPGLDAQRLIAVDFNDAAEQARSLGADVLRAGFIFHELLASQQAHAEMTSIGTVSAVILLVLMLLAFRGIWPTLLGFIPVMIGCLVATALLLLFSDGKVLLITMVFGSTIVGVAEDYGLLYIAGLYEDQPWDSHRRLRDVGRSIFLGLMTSVLGYLALLFVPIPGLRQVGLFSIVGLISAWTTVILWYPWLGSRLHPVGAGMRNLAQNINRYWPNVHRGYATGTLLLALLGVSLWGCAHVHANDDVRLLYAHDERLQKEQDQIDSVLKTPSGARFFLVQGRDEQEVLAREQSLLTALAKADPAGAGTIGVSNFVPSRTRQTEDAALLLNAVTGAAQVGKRLAQDLESPGLAEVLEHDLRAGSEPLTMSQWLHDPVSTPFRYLWRISSGGRVSSLVPIPAGVQLGDGKLRLLAAQVNPAIRLVDQIQEVSDTLASLRHQMAWGLGLGALIVFLSLLLVFRRRVLGTVLPAVLGAIAGFGSLYIYGLPLNLFGLIALALILGMGIDYGIFVQEGRPRQRAAALVAINMGACSNMLAFGMLIFSTTPALQAFGLVLAVGLGISWLTAPCFAIPERNNKK